jgi:peroxiredoxin
MRRPPGRRKGTSGRLALVGALILSIVLSLGVESRAEKAESGRAAPDFTVTTLDGARVRLADLKGKVVFLNIWATWCPPCRQEMPSMVKFYEMFRTKGLEIVAVSEDQDLQALRKFVKAYGVTFPVAQDEGKRVFGLYQATGVPETHLIDKGGVIRASQLGPFDWTHPAVLEKVRALLGR